MFYKKLLDCGILQSAFVANNIYASSPLKTIGHHTSTKDVRSPQRQRFYVLPCVQRSDLFCLTLPVADTQRSSWVINLKSRTAINDIIAPEECQAFWRAPQWVCLAYQLKQTSSAVKNVAHALRSIYITFGHWWVPAALDISNSTLKVKISNSHSFKSIPPKYSYSFQMADLNSSIP